MHYIIFVIPGAVVYDSTNQRIGLSLDGYIFSNATVAEEGRSFAVVHEGNTLHIPFDFCIVKDSETN